MIEERQIIETIQSAIEGAIVHLSNPRNDGVHFEAVVISPLFEGKSLVEQHQMVLLPLKKLFASKLHALGLKTCTTENWEKVD